MTTIGVAYNERARRCVNSPGPGHHLARGGDMPKGTRGRALCSIPECERIVHGRSLCALHYLRDRRGKPLSAPLKQWGSATDLCEVEACDEPIGRHGARGMCTFHYKRAVAYGDPHVTPVRSTVVERFWTHFERDPESGCWIWTSFKNNKGYGTFRIGNVTQLAHRYSYSQFVAPIEGDLTIDHLCCRKDCVNPAHLEPVTRRENLERYWRKALGL